MKTVIVNNWGRESLRKTKKLSIPIRRKPSQLCIEEAEWTMRPRFRRFVDAMREGKHGWPNLGHRKLQQKTTQLPAEDGFERQKQAFENIPSHVLAPYQGQYVVSHNGIILESDNNLRALTQRFVERHGHIPVYITKVGGKMRMNIPTRILR